MGYFKKLYNAVYDDTIDFIEKQEEIPLEQIRDESFEQYIKQATKELKSYTNNEKESMRIDCQMQLKDLEKEINKSWKSVAHKTAIGAITHSYVGYALFIPAIIFLLLGRVLTSQIAAIIALALLLTFNLKVVYCCIVYYLTGIYKEYKALEYLYSYYGTTEATIKVVDTRGLSQLNRKYRIFSNHHLKEEPPT